MQMQGISGNNDAWIQFVKLTQEARKRNQGITSETAVKASNVQSFANKRAGAAFQNQSVSFSQNASPVNNETKHTTKILGGLFDTYV